MRLLGSKFRHSHRMQKELAAHRPRFRSWSEAGSSGNLSRIRHSRAGGNPVVKNSLFRLAAIVAALALLVGTTPLVSAACSNPNQQSCSGSYGVSETFFGTGGTLCDPTNPSTSLHSSNYCAKTSVGELGVGNTLGTVYQAQAGFNTNREPSLAVLVGDSVCNNVHGGTSGPSFDAGTLTTSAVNHVTANFSVMSYLASGYVVQTSGTPPKYTSGATTHYLTTLSNAAPVVGTEGFGMNLKQNAILSGFGFNVSQQPDVTFGFGKPAPASANGGLRGYDTQDVFSYNDGDEIAYSNSSSGVTCYFPSYVFAISNVTPAGTYTFNQSIVVTSTF